MLIGIDGNEANVGERVGVNVWGFEILKALAARLPRAAEGGPRNDVIVYLSRPPKADMPKETENWRYRVIGPGGLWTRWRLPPDLYFHRPRPDVFLSLSHYAPSFAPMPRVISIMDLSFLKFPEAFKPAVRWQLTNWTRESVRKAARVITISEFNKKEIIKYYGYPEEKISVVYPGVSKAFKTFKGQAFDYKGLALDTGEGPTLSKCGIRGRYLLFVGTLQPKKNLGRLVEAFGRVREKFPEVELVVAGKTWSQFADMKDQINEIATSSRPEVGTPRNDGVGQGVRYLGFVVEKDLPGLVAGAEALVLPSLYEGFGIPAVEAMSMGTPVLASNATSLPEIIGDHANGRAGAGILFDPYDIKDMADKICRLLAMSKAERQRLAEKGKIRAKMFNWNTAAEKVLEVLLAVILRPKAEESRRDPSLRSG